MLGVSSALISFDTDCQGMASSREPPCLLDEGAFICEQRKTKAEEADGKQHASSKVQLAKSAETSTDAVNKQKVGVRLVVSGARLCGG